MVVNLYSTCETKRQAVFDHLTQILSAQKIKYYGHSGINWRKDLTYFCRMGDIYQTFCSHEDETVITVNPLYYELFSAIYSKKSECLQYSGDFEFFIQRAYKEFKNIDIIVRNTESGEDAFTYALEYTDNLKNWGIDATVVDDDKDGYRTIISKIKENLGGMHTLSKGIRSE
jgi:hypothetical protein